MPLLPGGKSAARRANSALLGAAIDGPGRIYPPILWWFLGGDNLSSAGKCWLFIKHFQQMAKGHFIVLRLQQKYGAQEVERLYEELQPMPAAASLGLGTVLPHVALMPRKLPSFEGGEGVTGED